MVGFSKNRLLASVFSTNVCTSSTTPQAPCHREPRHRACTVSWSTMSQSTVSWSNMSQSTVSQSTTSQGTTSRVPCHRAPLHRTPCHRAPRHGVLCHRASRHGAECHRAPCTLCKFQHPIAYTYARDVGICSVHSVQLNSV